MLFQEITALEKIKQAQWIGQLKKNNTFSWFFLSEAYVKREK